MLNGHEMPAVTIFCHSAKPGVSFFKSAYFVVTKENMFSLIIYWKHYREAIKILFEWKYA